MMSYKQYLEKQNYSDTTIKHYLQRIKAFTTWLKKQQIQAGEIDYKKCTEIYPRFTTQKPTSSNA